ncbi:MAG TPA: hypothetical protein VFX12_00575 [Vicinamibacterales bacterium]|nr:hypothetical protein [Vicinamibacterales bacterium]
MRRFLARGAVLATVLVFAAGCGSSILSQIPTAPVQTITQTFTGTLTPSGGETHPFTATNAGAITATLSAVGSGTAVTMGLSIGTWDGAACHIVVANDQAVAGSSLGGNASSAGNYCVRLYDVGTLTGPTAYTVVVVHP